MSTPYAPTKEVRFAVVMYGGVSLAIYIHGVAQELIQLVRATAPKTVASGQKPLPELLYSDGDLNPTTGGVSRETSAAVYREAARMLDRDPDAGPPPMSTPIRTRFVVDVISGTSAGGINGVYLAKALANEQEMGQLKDLWVEKADIAQLVNDRHSSPGPTNARPPRHPPSVLDGRKMYEQLLQALDGMDVAPRDASAESRLVDELDLWITTTDVRGATVPVDLHDRLVFEKRHRKVFHFTYRGKRSSDESKPSNDFRRDHNPILAFAARATSAFPFAFTPVQLSDIDEVLSRDPFRVRYADRTSEHSDWRRFFDEYLKPGGGETIARAGQSEPGYRTQSFADGGYLDNKPFSWVTDTLYRRTADLPVDRRLIYIEPDPEAPLVSPHRAGETVGAAAAWAANGPLAHIDPAFQAVRPNAVENTAAALSGIPRYEPIREDLERVLERNREVDRLRDVTSILDGVDLGSPQSKPDRATWRTQSVAQAAKDRPQYAAYYSLKVALVADEFAVLITRLAAFDERSDEHSAIRSLVQAWLKRHHPFDGEGEQSQNEFLIRFDVPYRLRRISFLQSSVDKLLDGADNDTTHDLRKLKLRLSDTLAELRRVVRSVRRRSDTNVLIHRVRALGLERRELRCILDGAKTNTESIERADKLLDDPERDGRLTALAELLAQQLKPVFAAARNVVDLAIKDVRNEGTRAKLAHRFDHFEDFDSIRFPISYGHVGEADRVEVIRISPQDATSIVDEAGSNGDTGERRRKLAGTSIGHFGGFFSQAWRRNDLLWGRLDAAERLLTTLLPDTISRARLIERAHLAILHEELVIGEREELLNTLVQTLLAGDPRVVDEEARVRQTLEMLHTPEQILQFMKSPRYEVDRKLDPERMVSTVGRLTAVTGKVLDASTQSQAVKRPLRWVIRVGRLVWGLAEISTPRSVAHLLARWWAQLLILISVALILAGTALGLPEAARLGWTLLAGVVVLKIAMWTVNDLADWIRERRSLHRAALVTVGAIAIASTVWAAVSVFSAIF